MKHVIISECDNVTLVKIGKTVIKIWSDTRGHASQNLDITAMTDVPVAFSVIPVPVEVKAPKWVKEKG